MSLMSPDEPMIRPLTQCPYCDHHSPEGSKFCNACGAALHLVPCPHCGAVNDVSKMDTCGSCHGDLRTARAPRMPKPAVASTAAEAPADAPADEDFLTIHLPLEDAKAADEVPQPPAPMYAQDPPPPLAPSEPRRPRWPWLAGGVLALLALGYYAWQPPARELEPPRAGPAPKRAEPAASTPRAAVVESATDAALKAAEAALQRAGTKAEPAAAATPPPPATEQAAPKPTPRSGPARAASAARATAEAQQQQRSRPVVVDDPVLRPPPSSRSVPPPGPCTEAMAALGLCTSDVRPRSP